MRLGQQCAHPQQRDFVQDESGVGWHGGQPFDCRRRFLHVGVRSPAQQGLHQCSGGNTAQKHFAVLEEPIDNGARAFDRAWTSPASAINSAIRISAIVA